MTTLPSPTTNADVIRSRPGRRHDPQRHVAEVDRPRRRRTRGSRTAGAARRPDRRAPGSPSCSAIASAPAAWSGSTWVSATATIRPPRSAGHLDRPVQRLARRVARIDEHERCPTDEVGVDRLTGDAATGRHLDPDRRRRRRPRRRPRRADRAPAAPRSPRSSSACSSCMSVVEVGNHMPRPPAAIDSSASIGRCQACADDLVPDQGHRRARRERRGEEPGVEPPRHRRRRHPARQRARAGPSGAAGRAPPRSPGTRPGPRATATAPPTRSAPGRRVGQQHADLLERLADRGDVRGQRRRRLEVAAETLGRRARRSGPTARQAPDPHPRRRRARPGTRACRARTPSSPADASAGPRARAARAEPGRRSPPAEESPPQGGSRVHSGDHSGRSRHTRVGRR